MVVSSMISEKECLSGERLLKGGKVKRRRVMIVRVRGLEVGSIFE